MNKIILGPNFSTWSYLAQAFSNRTYPKLMHLQSVCNLISIARAFVFKHNIKWQISARPGLSSKLGPDLDDQSVKFIFSGNLASSISGNRDDETDTCDVLCSCNEVLTGRSDNNNNSYMIIMIIIISVIIVIITYIAVLIRSFFSCFCFSSLLKSSTNCFPAHLANNGDSDDMAVAMTMMMTMTMLLTMTMAMAKTMTMMMTMAMTMKMMKMTKTMTMTMFILLI